MDKKLALPDIDFADSRYKSLQILEDDTLIIYLNSWKEQPLKIIFKDIIYFSYKVGDLPRDLYEITDSTPLLEETILSLYKKIPETHFYKLFQFEDIYNFPFIQVIAESVQVL